MLFLFALVLPAGANLLRNNAALIGGFGELAASFAVAVNMPGEGLELLRKRFQEQLRQIPEQTAAQPAPPPTPALPALPEPDPEPDRREESAPPLIAQPKIPEEFRAALVSEDFSGKDSTVLIKYGAGYVNNATRHSREDVEAILEKKLHLGFEDTREPQVLIIHTHATESFERFDTAVYDTRNTWRSTDNNNNMVAVGAAMAQALEESGIGVIHDTTQHDNPSYNSSYQRSAKTVSEYLERHPSIRVVLDLHRDAMEREDRTIVKPVTVINGKKAAQIMIISGCDDGTMNMPGWRENLRLAAAFTGEMERQWPSLTRPVYFAYRKYNQHLSPGALLLEFGSNANTLDEALYAATLAGYALADLIWDNTILNLS